MASPARRAAPQRRLANRPHVSGTGTRCVDQDGQAAHDLVDVDLLVDAAGQGFVDRGVDATRRDRLGVSAVRASGFTVRHACRRSRAERASAVCFFTR